MRMKYLITMITMLISSVILYSIEITGTLEGTVTDNAGFPVANANISFEGLHYGVITEMDGNYIIEGLPEGTYSLICSHFTYLEQIIDSIKIGAFEITSQNITLTEFDEEEFKVEPKTNISPKKLKTELKLRLMSPEKPDTKKQDTLKSEVPGGIVEKRNSGSIKGKVSDKYGNPIRFAEVIFIETDFKTKADFLGEYFLTDVEAGIYTVLYSKPGYERRKFLGIQIKENETTVKKVILPFLYK